MHRTRLSVNLNKVALIRNARGGNLPNLIQVAIDCESFGADGITVHPRPDERHVRFADLQPLKDVVSREFNIEGYPSEDFIDQVCAVVPHQCTLVPDLPGALTSDSGWDTINHKSFLKEVISALKAKDIRVSLFLNADPGMVDAAAETGADRIELYTGDFAKGFSNNREAAVQPHVETAALAVKAGLDINAGHDLNLDNLAFYLSSVSMVSEVSIGHALICDALYYGLANAIQMYLQQINESLKAGFEP